MELVQIILIVLIIILLIYFVIWMFTKSTQLTNMMDATVPQTILAKTLPMNSNSNNYTYSTWFIINDWNYHFGQEKVILSRIDKDNNSSPTITLGSMENNVTVKVSCYNTSGSDYADAPEADRTESSEVEDTTTIMSDLLGFSKDVFGTTIGGGCFAENTPAKRVNCIKCMSAAGKYTIDGAEGKCTKPLSIYDEFVAPTYYDNLTNCSTLYKDEADKPKFETCLKCAYTDGTFSNGLCTEKTAVGAAAPASVVTTAKGAAIHHECKVDNIPLQKWVNLIVSVYNRTLDVYVDGKLVRTCVLPGVPLVNSAANILVTPANLDQSPGGFVGYTTNFQFWPSASNPQKAYDIYKDGLGGSILSNLINKFRLRLTFLQDNKEAGSFEI